MSGIEISSDETEIEDTGLNTTNCIANTSNGITHITNDLENGRWNIKEINKSSQIFKELIDKCYENPNFPNSNIEVIDNLYKSLPSDFVDSEEFLKLLKDVNQTIWPDSGTSSYLYVKHVYDQLLQFKASMEVQDRKISVENKEINIKKFKKLKKLKDAYKKIRKQIEVLDEYEMDINKNSNFDASSPYILKDKFERKAVQIYKRMCELMDEPYFLEKPLLCFKQTKYTLVNKTVEKFYNLNKTFPDYFEIYTLLKLLNKKKKLNWNENELKKISQDTFTKLGKQLKSQRLNEYFSNLLSITMEKDPAEENEELKKKLDESNKKFHADLNALTKKFINKQEYGEETEGSSLNDTECENSSGDDCDNKNNNLSREFKHINILPVKRKRGTISDESNECETKTKNPKVMYKESFDLIPCKSELNTSSNAINNERNINTKMVSDNTMVKNNDDVLDEIISVDIEQVTEKVSKTAVEDIDNVSNTKIGKDTEQVTDELLETTKIINNCDGNVENHIVVDGESFTDNENSGNLVIDKNVPIYVSISKNQKQNIIKEGDIKESIGYSETIIIDSEDERSITKPEVIHEEDNSVNNNVMSVKIDDSDVEIINCDIPKVAVQNKKSLESIIKSMNFDKKYKWDKQPIQKRVASSSMSYLNMDNHSSNSDNSFNKNLVNHWISNNKNNVQPPKHVPSSHVRPSFRHAPPYVPSPRQYMHSKQPLKILLNKKMQSTIQKSTTERQITQCILNGVQEQRNFTNNQSVVQQHVTTMTTTTTTVQKIVRASNESVQNRIATSKHVGDHPYSSFESNKKSIPELIELD